MFIHFIANGLFNIIQARICTYLKTLPQGCLKLLDFRTKIMIMSITQFSGIVCRMTVCTYISFVVTKKYFLCGNLFCLGDGLSFIQAALCLVVLHAHAFTQFSQTRVVILTIVWVHHTPNAGQNMLLMISCKKAEKGKSQIIEKKLKKTILNYLIDSLKNMLSQLSCSFFLFLAFLVEKCKKAYFYQHLECTAPKLQPKYTTQSQVGRLSIFIPI